MIILASWLLADFLSGLVHWWEDRAIIGTSPFAFINSVRADNERHHLKPGYFLRFTWWGNINTTAPFSFALAGLLLLFGAPMILWLTAFFISFGNLVHRWAHEPKEKLPRVITLLQRTGLFISQEHHWGHHFENGRLVSRENSYRRFCVMTNWLNPALDYVGFFRLLEKFK